MPDIARQTNAAVRALIDGTFGCLDAAAETINARNGGSVSKGTLSKRLSGQHGWPVEDVTALEDAAGRHPVTRILARRLVETTASGGCIYGLSGEASREFGEAIAAVMRAAQSSDDGSSAAAVVEIDEAIQVLRDLRAAIAAPRIMGVA